MPGVAEIKPHGKDGYVAFTQSGVRQVFAQDLPEEQADARERHASPSGALFFLNGETLRLPLGFSIPPGASLCSLLARKR